QRSAKCCEDLAVLGEAARLGLREDRPPVGQHVVLTLAARDRLGFETLCVELGRETRGPLVVAASGRAVVDLDAHNSILRGQDPALEMLEGLEQRPPLVLVAR